jgi:hypothetical protein
VETHLPVADQVQILVGLMDKPRENDIAFVIDKSKQLNVSVEVNGLPVLIAVVLNSRAKR